MKYRGDRKYIYWGITAAAVICVGISFYYILFHGTRLSLLFGRFFNICFPIIVGFVLAYLFTPIINSIEYRILIPIHTRISGKKEWKRKKLMRALSICLTYILIFFCLYELFDMIIPEIVTSIGSIGDQFPKAFNKYYDLAVNYLNQNKDVANFLSNNLSFDISKMNSQDMINWLLKHIENIGSFISTLSTTIYSTLKTTLNIVIGIIVSVYLAFGKENFAAQAKKICYSMFEMHNANRLIKDCRFIHKTFIGFISGKIFDSIIIGLLCFIGTRLIGLHYPVLISVVVGVTNVIPFFGPYLGAIPCTLLLLLIAPIEALYFLIFIVVLQQIDGNIIGPRILGNSTGISGFWVIFAITFFGGIYGIMGMIIGVPVFAVIYAFVKRFVNRRLAGKSLPSDTSLYRDTYEIRNGEFVTKEHLFTEIKNPKGSEGKNTADDTEKYHLFKSIFSKIQGHDSSGEKSSKAAQEDDTDANISKKDDAKEQETDTDKRR